MYVLFVGGLRFRQQLVDGRRCLGVLAVLHQTIDRRRRLLRFGLEQRTLRFARIVVVFRAALGGPGDGNGQQQQGRQAGADRFRRTQTVGTHAKGSSVSVD